MTKIKIKNDIFKICERVKKIKQSYFVMFNLKTSCYELHDNNLKPTLCLNLSNKLDAGVILKIYNCLLKSADEIFKEVENHNKKLAEKNNQQLLEKANDELKSYIHFLNNNDENFDFNSVNKTEWV